MIDFPNSPTDGQVFTSGNSSWVWNAAASQWRTSLIALNPKVQRLSGDGTTVQFTLNSTPPNINFFDVYITGLYQQKNTYTLLGNVLTFSEAPPSGTENIEVEWGSSLDVGVPSDLSVSTGKLQDASVTATKLASGAAVSNIGYTPVDLTKQKRGLDFTGRVSPSKHHHDWLWYQFSGTITPAQVPIYCANIDAAEKLAVWYVQKLYTELKNTENDSVWDGLHWALPTNAGTFSNIVSGGGSAPPNGVVDYDNATGVASTSMFVYTGEWFEVIIGSNGTNEIYTMALSQGLNTDTPAWPTRLIYQKTRNIADWRTDYSGTTLALDQTVYNSPPKCTTRTTSFTSTSAQVGIMLYPVTLELNF